MSGDETVGRKPDPTTSARSIVGADGGLRAKEAFLARSAELLHAYGTPAHRLERVLQKVAASLAVEASFFSTPTSLFVSFGCGLDARTLLLRAEPAEVDLGKLAEFDELMEEVERGRLGSVVALERAERLAAAPPRYRAPLTAAAFGLASACAARFFGGGTAEVVLSFALGPGIFALGRVLARHPAGPGLFEPIAAFLAAFVSLGVARLVHPLDDRLVTLSALIVLLPGLTLTTGLIELATRHLASGVARLAGAAATFLTLLLGVALAWRIGDLVWPHAAPFEPPVLPGVGEWIALALAPLGFAVLFDARMKELGVIYVTGIAGYLAARWGAASLGPDLGPFLGALAVGVTSNLYARLADRPALIPLTPGILLLVPGSLGYRSLTSFLDRQAMVGVEWAFQTGLVAASLVAGLLAANLVVPPRRVL